MITIKFEGSTTSSNIVTVGNIIIDKDDEVVFDASDLDDSKNTIVKIDISYNTNDSTVVDETYNYSYSEEFRGNMLQIATSRSNNIPNRFTHKYNWLNDGYKTIFNFYTLNGIVYTFIINLTFVPYSFADSVGDLTLLNSQFIDNEYNHLFVIAETANGKIVQFCLKQSANRSQAKFPIPESEFSIEGEIVKIGDENAYLYLINETEPIYLMVNEWPKYKKIVSISDYTKLIKTIQKQIDIVSIQEI